MDNDASGQIIAGLGCFLMMIWLGSGLLLCGICFALALVVWSRYGR